MMAVDKDPTQETAAERSGATLPRKGRAQGPGSVCSSVARRRSTPMAARTPSSGFIWPASTKSSVDSGASRRCRLPKGSKITSERSSSTRSSAYAVYAPSRAVQAGRSSGPTRVPLFAMEQAIIADPERKLALIATRPNPKDAGDRAGGHARLFVRPMRYRQDDPASCKSSVLRFSSETKRATR